MKKLRIHIAGKITGLVYEEALRMFAEAEGELLRCGCEPVNPMTKNGLDGDGKPHTWVEFMREDIPLLLSCDAIYLLPNWKESKGARLEKHIADELGMLIVTHGFVGKRVFPSSADAEPLDLVLCNTPAPIEIEPGWKGCVRPKGHSGHCTAVPVTMDEWIVCQADGCNERFIQTDPDAEVDLCPPCDAALMRAAA